MQGMLEHRLLGWIGWTGGAQLVNRVIRLATTVVVARVLLPEEYGMVALIFTVHELIGAILQGSTQTRLVQVDEDALPALCATSYTLNWIIALVLLMLQISSAALLSFFYAESALFLPICVLGLIYLQLPFAMVQTALNLRAGKLAVVAKVDSLQSFLDAGLTITLALAGLGIWALVLPKLLVTPVWIVLHRRHCDWRPERHWCVQGWRQVSRYSGNVIVSDLLCTLRHNVDYLLVGYFWGLEALGVYFFAYNAGLGISLSLQQAIRTALLPYLCQEQRQVGSAVSGFYYGLKLTVCLMLVLILAQTLLAPLYVPLVFGQRWVELGALPIMIVLCCSALPRAVIEGVYAWLRAAGQPGFVLRLNAGLTSVFALVLLLAVPYGLMAVAWSVLIVQLLLVPAFVVLAHRRVRRDERTRHYALAGANAA